MDGWLFGILNLEFGFWNLDVGGPVQIGRGNRPAAQRSLVGFTSWLGSRWDNFVRHQKSLNKEVIGFGDLWGPSGDHLGNRFDEVIGFITDPDLPECADRSVSSSEYRWSEN